MMKNSLCARAINTFVNQAIGSCETMSSTTLRGFVLAKDAGVILATRTRAILTMPWTLRLCHGQVNALLMKPLNDTGVQSRLIYAAGGTKGTSATDVALGSHLMVERGLDMKSRFGATTSDISTFFDKVPLGTLAKKLQCRCDTHLAAAAIRLHMRPKIELCILEVRKTLSSRKAGLTTGTSNAAILQRVPVEDCVSRIMDTVVRNAATFEDEQFGVAF